MSELKSSQLSTPSGYEQSFSLVDPVNITRDVLPWLENGDSYTLYISRCVIQGGKEFLLASAIGSNPTLIEAANGMTEKQKQHTDNMFYSRLPELINNGYSPNIETMASTTTGQPIYVMRNRSGQRIYFSRSYLGVDEEIELGPTILRLAVCDKNKQDCVMKVLSSLSIRSQRLRNSG
jgi:hypothetical protein